MSASAITKFIDELSNSTFTEHEKKELYDAALRFAWNIESEQDTAQRLYHGHLPLACAQTGIDLNLFKFLSQNPDKVFSVGELALETGADPALLGRLLRFYASQSMIRQTADGTFTASNITHNLSIPGTEKGIKHYSLTMTPCYNAIPGFLQKTSYANPSDSTPFNLAFHTDMPVFQWRKYNPVHAKVGQAFMAAQRMGQRSVWDGQTPMHDWELTPEELANDRVMMCDVGGGSGHQCVEFRKYHPELQGRIITEDLPMIQDMIPNKEELQSLNITTQNHDFMTKQPIHGAKVYYLRNVIHNWNDKASETILSQISEAMAHDSVLVLDEIVMPSVGATWKQASMDIAMMTMLAAMERTEEHFVRLLATAGLQLRDMWTYDKDYGDTIIVAEKIPQPYTNGVNGVHTPVSTSSDESAVFVNGFH